MKLLIDATNLARGGGLIVLGSILRSWRQQGQPFEITVFVSRSVVGEDLLGYRDDIQIKPFMLGQSPTRVYVGRKYILGKKMEKLRPDVVLAIGGMVGNCNVPQHVHHQNLRWLMDWPLFETILGHGLKNALRWRRQHTEAMFTLKNARCNTFISDYMRQMACRLVPESSPRNFTVHNAPGVPVKTDGFNPLPKPLIAAIQNADYYKDAPTLIRVLEQCVRRRPDVDWRLEIAGGGDWKSACEMARELGILNRIDFLGHCSLERIVNLLDEAFCMVFTSRCEGFGIPPLEAMARGCAVISSNADALPEIVQNGGVMVQPGDVEAFASSVVDLYEDLSMRLKLVQAGLEHVKKFSWKASAEKLALILKNNF